MVASALLQAYNEAQQAYEAHKRALAAVAHAQERLHAAEIARVRAEAKLKRLLAATAP